MLKSPVLETNDLIIKEIEFKDARDMYEYASLPEVGPMAGWETHTSVRYSRMIIRMQREKNKGNIPAVFAIHLKDSGKMIGTCELYAFSTDDKSAELGYTISPYYQNRGYATQAAKAMMEFGFNSIKLDRIICTTFPNNLASKRVIEKCDFRFVREKKNGYVLYDGTIHDLLVYELTKKEYEELNNGV